MGIDEISRALGELEREAQHARESRRVTHEKLDALTDQLRALGPRVADLERLAPEIRDFMSWRDRIRGGGAVLWGFGILLGALGGEAARWFFHR